MHVSMARAVGWQGGPRQWGATVLLNCCLVEGHLSLLQPSAVTKQAAVGTGFYITMLPFLLVTSPLLGLQLSRYFLPHLWFQHLITM